jgi:N-acetylglucosaminyl-diphospho-decaprenol L-rhamnosyltransferase
MTATGRESERASRGIDVVVVHFGDWSVTSAALEAVRSALPGAPLWVVDNGPAGPRPDARTQGARVLSAGRNLGYGAACNLAAREGSGEFLLFLNNDAEIQPGGAEAMASVFARKPRAAAVGPALVDSAAHPRRSIHRAPTPRRVLFENLMLPRLFPGLPFFDGHHTTSTSHRVLREVETLSGAAFMARRTAFEAIGGFDEAFFFYAEESDLFARLRDAGGEIYFEPAARVLHHAGVSSAALPASERDRRLYDGLTRYARKHHGPRGEAATARAIRWGARLRWALAHLVPGARGSARRARYADLLETTRPR